MIACQIPCIPEDGLNGAILSLSYCWLQYWDDPADNIQEREGTLLPLWRFTAVSAQGRQVTALAWNPAYPGRKPCAHLKASLIPANCRRDHIPHCNADSCVIPAGELSMMVRRTSCILSWFSCADLFAAGYGSFDAQRQGAGAVVCFSLKAPSPPESQHQTPSGAALLAALYIPSCPGLHELPHQFSSARVNLRDESCRRG